MKKIFSLFFVFLFVTSLFAFTADDIKIFTLENGLKIYFLEDSSSPTVRLELCVNAGSSYQNTKNSGLFTLYARLCGGEISNDSVRFVSKVAPSAAEKAVLSLSEKLKTVQPTDSELSAILKTMNTEYKEFSESAAGYLNSAIETKVFAERPWSRESTVNPTSFASKSNEVARSYLQSIGENFYIPGNSVLFVSGNITENAILEITKKYFSSFSAKQFKNQADEDEKKVLSAIESGKLKIPRKFVLYHKDFSDEMTQIVLQYKNLDSDEAEALSSFWNMEGSSFKKLLLKQRNLKILGDEYIDVSHATEKSASRLIIQSLLGKAKVSPIVQANLFLEMSRDSDVFSKKELQKSLKAYKTDFTRLSESSENTMESFSRFLESYKNEGFSPVEAFFAQDEAFSKINIQDLQKKVLDEEPFVFVLVNSALYQKYAAEFKKSGFEAINQGESAYYSQLAYKNILKNSEKKSEENKSLLEEIYLSAERFISKNRSEFSSITLKNGIPVTIKRSDSSKTAVLSLTIAGGELLFADKVPGLSSVLTNSIAFNIQNQLDLFAQNGAVNGFYDVSSQTLSTHSIITVACLASELDFALQAAYTALVYCDISPALADGVTYDERTHWRLKTGSSDFQLLCEAVRILYENTDYPKLYKDTEDKPAENLNFTRIQEAYPILLDSSRFSLILTGNLRENERLQKTLDATFGSLSTLKETASTDLRLPRPDFSKISETEKKISIRHLFLTDISKDKAGPRPAILVPTTKFLDPVLYCISSPDLSATDLALFDALLIEIGQRMEKTLNKKYKETTVKIQIPENDLPFARLVVTKVEKTSEVDKIFTESISSLKKDISDLLERATDGVIDLEKSDLLSTLENNWLMNVIGEAASQEGTARLIQIGEVQKNPRLYLNQYEAISKAKAEDYFLILTSYFEHAKSLRLYSKDSK